MLLLKNNDAKAARGQPNQAKKKMYLEMFYDKFAEGLVDAVRKFQAQAQTNRPANRLVGREQLYIEFQ
jgi:hypothetical protein